MSVTGAIVAGAGLIGSIGSSAIGANAAGNAASAQAAASQKASDLAGAAGTKALGIQQDASTAAQSQIAPYTAAGAGGLNALQYGLGTGGTANGSGVGQGSLTTPYSGSFSAPTALTEQNDPGYQARLQLGTDAIQKSAAARGSVVTGGTAKALGTYGQDYASNEYGNVYNRALTDYTTKYNAYNTDQTNQYNKLAALTGMGQQSATTAGTLGLNAANSQAGTITGTAATQGQDLTNAAAATASGYVGQGNAWGQGLSGATSSLSNLALIGGMNNTAPSNPYSNLSNAQHLASSSGSIPTLTSGSTSMIGY
jgi:hypothetical protein